MKNEFTRLSFEKIFNVEKLITIFYMELSKNDEILLTLSMPVKIISANKKVHDCAGRVAVMRGPVVYCLEGIDNGKDLNSIRIDIKEKGVLSEREFLVPNILIKGYKEPESDSLYFEATENYIEAELKFIPYFAYENRGETDMLIWILKK